MIYYLLILEYVYVRHSATKSVNARQNVGFEKQVVAFTA